MLALSADICDKISDIKLMTAVQFLGKLINLFSVKFNGSNWLLMV